MPGERNCGMQIRSQNSWGGEVTTGQGLHRQLRNKSWGPKGIWGRRGWAEKFDNLFVL